MTAEPGLTPRSPGMVVAPVLVTVVPAKTEKLPAAPGVGEICASGAARETPVGPLSATAIAMHNEPSQTAREGFHGYWFLSCYPCCTSLTSLLD